MVKKAKKPQPNVAVYEEGPKAFAAFESGLKKALAYGPWHKKKPVKRLHSQ